MKSLIVSIMIVSVLVIGTAFGETIEVTPNVPDALKNALDAANDGDVFVLARDGIYPNSTAMETHASVTIKAADGEGELPKVVRLPNSEGNYSGQVIKMFGGKVLIKNIHFEAADGDLAPWGNTKVLQPTSPMVKLHVDGCVITNARIGITANAAVDTAIIENCLFLNFMAYSVNDGRFIDWRKDHFDYIRLQNNTMVFGQGFGISRWGGFLPEQSQCPNLIADHNTFMNVWGTYGVPNNFTRVENVQITNNLIVNGHMHGSDQISQRYTQNARNGYFDGEKMIEDSLWMPGIVDVLGPQGLFLFAADMTDSAGTEITMQNNNIFNTEDLLELWASTDHTTPPHIYGNQFGSVLNDTINHYFADPLTFGKAPAPPISQLEIVMANKDTMSLGGNSWAGVEPWSGFTANFEILTPEELDLSYNTNSRSYTQAAGGFPVGDLNWFPEKKQQWIAAGRPTLADPTNVEDRIASVPEAFRLEQNYPNPFNPSTTIKYTLNKSTQVKVTVYNILGETVKTLVDQKQNAGRNEVVWNGTNKAGIQMASGIYYYSVATESASKTMKMVLLK